MEMNIWWLTVVETVVALMGFCLGRLTGKNKSEEKLQEKQKGNQQRKRSWDGQSTSGRVGDGGIESFVGSPVSGEVEDFREGECPIVIIRPVEDKIYAPTGGKITKLFPLGNALLFHTEFGAELYIQAGDSADELLGRYFRPRVVQNEIVGKGKLLMEFDRRGLESEGASAKVSLEMESGMYESCILAAAGERVRSGEEILRVRSDFGDHCGTTVDG